MNMQEEVIYQAYGKINLGLDVVRRLSNGYHEVRMIMQTVELHDVVSMKKLPTNEITINCNSSKIPCDEHNLAYKAAKMMQQQYPVCGGVSIKIEKNIPVAAGMAGGSTDCAAVLKGMNELYQLQLTTEQLCEIGVKLGADVPYCIWGGTALSEGIGEVLTKIKEPPACVILLAKPDIDVSTKYVYEHLNLKNLKEHPDIDGMLTDMEHQDLKGLCNKMSNVLETVTGEKYPIIGTIEQCMKQCGALQAIMSGSGPTVFGVFEDKISAEKAAEIIKDRKLTQEVYVSAFK